MLEGLLVVLSPANLFLLVAGVAGGVIVGCLPGLTATMGVAILLPFTFVLEPASGLVVLGGLYIGAMYGDAIPATLIGVPGTPAAMATTLDAYPLTKQGRSGDAIVAACISSAVGALIGGAALLTIAPPLARAALAFGPPEFFWLGVFALTIIGSVIGDSFLRGLGGGLLGLLLGMVGIAASGATQRFTFGFYQIAAGIALPVALIGLFAIPQLITLAENRKGQPKVAKYEWKSGTLKRVAREVLRPVGVLRAGALGTFLGILPGAGAPLAAIVAYNEAVRWSKDSSKFGKGDIRGVVAAETANNASAPAEMVPLLTLGIPGSNVAAIMLGALLFHGLRFGPSLFVDAPDVVFGFMWAFILGGFLVFLLGLIMAPALVQMVRAPITYLVPAIGALTVVGSYAMRNNMFDVYLMMFVGVIGYFLTKLKVPAAPVALGLILGPIVDDALDTSMRLAQSAGYVQVFFARPISLVLIVLTILSLGWVVYSKLAQRRWDTATTANDPARMPATGAEVVERSTDDDTLARSSNVHKEPANIEFGNVNRGVGGLLNYDTYSGVCLSALGVLVYAQSGGWDERAWMLPNGIALGMVCLGLALLGVGARRRVREKVFTSWLAAKDVFIFVTSTLVFFVLVPRLGYFLASWIFVCALSLVLRGRLSLLPSVAIVAGSGLGVGVLYWLFSGVLDVPLPTGDWI